MTEPQFVKYLQQTFPFGFGKGIGDDTSVVKVDPADSHQLITKDILIQDIHFRLSDITLEQLALKSLAVNLSDIAAMGGVPQYFYLGLGFPKTMPREKVQEFFKGLEKGCKQWNVQLAGGDFSSSPALFISITLIGKARHPVYRHTAQTHDLIGITNVTGESAIGLQVLLQGEYHPYFVPKHLHVSPQLQKGLRLAPHVNAMIDLSDGLLLDLNRILTASGKGAVIHYENIPVTSQIKTICKQNGWDEHRFVLAGGEDYALLFTISKENAPRLKQEGIDCHIIGEITDKNGVLSVEDQGNPLHITQFGYDHFNSNY